MKKDEVYIERERRFRTRAVVVECKVAQVNRNEWCISVLSVPHIIHVPPLKSSIKGVDVPLRSENTLIEHFLTPPAAAPTRAF